MFSFSGLPSLIFLLSLPISVFSAPTAVSSLKIRQDPFEAQKVNTIIANFVESTSLITTQLKEASIVVDTNFTPDQVKLKLDPINNNFALGKARVGLLKALFETTLGSSNNNDAARARDQILKLEYNFDAQGHGPNPDSIFSTTSDILRGLDDTNLPQMTADVRKAVHSWNDDLLPNVDALISTALLASDQDNDADLLTRIPI